jgi:periplasmic divalent cation tolerance protein
MAAFVFVYVTTPSRELACALAQEAVEKRLAACGNVLPQMVSIYRWEDKIEQAQESVLILKTQSVLFDDLSAFIRARHPYETPCIVALDVSAGNEDFLGWIKAVT